MKIYNGKVNLIGNGTWMAGPNGEGGTLLTVLEIGDTHLKRVYIPDYLKNYLTVGTETRILIMKASKNEAVLALEVDGKKYKIERSLMRKYFMVKRIIAAIGIGIAGAAVTGFLGMEPGMGMMIGLSVYLFYSRGKMKEFDNF